jgi:hypothetical protein
MLLDDPLQVGLGGQLIVDRTVGHRSLDVVYEGPSRWILGGTGRQLN